MRITFQYGSPNACTRHRMRAIPNALQLGINGALIKVLGGYLGGETLCRVQKNAVRYRAGSRHGQAESDAGEYKGIVALADSVAFPIEGDRSKRASCGNNSTSIGPVDRLLGRAL